MKHLLIILFCLFIAGIVWGEPQRGINYNHDCPSWAQKYNAICEVRK